MRKQGRSTTTVSGCRAQCPGRPQRTGAANRRSEPAQRARLGGQIAIGAEITTAQNAFGKLFREGDTSTIGAILVTVMHVPGHTPADSDCAPSWPRCSLEC
jgi:hypothetical protein